MATSLTSLILRCQQESDNVNSLFISTAEWTEYINQSYFEIYGLTAQVYGADYYVQSPATGYTFVTDGINQFFALPADFFKLLGVDVMYGAPNQWVSLKPFAFADRNRFSAINTPIPAAGQTVRLFYIPAQIPLTIGTDTIAQPLAINGWDEYIVVDAAMKALAKEESDVSVLMARKQALIDRINAEAENRDAGNPASIVDARGSGSQAMSYRLNGSNLWLIGFRISGWPGPDWDDHLGRWW